MPCATKLLAVADRGLTEARRSGDVRRSVLYLGADLGVFFRVPEGFLRRSRGSSNALDGLPRPSSTGLKAAHSSKASLMWGWTKDDSFLRWNWARSARFRSTRSEADVSWVRGRVDSSWAKRPWCVGVGVGAVPPRLSSLNIPASFLGLCLLAG